MTRAAIMGAVLALCLGITVGTLLRRLFVDRTAGCCEQLVAATLLSPPRTQETGSVLLATGRLDDDAEGLFILDCAAGDLHCVFLNPRTGTVTGHCRTNVTQHLEIPAKARPQYAMTIARVGFLRNSKASVNPADITVWVVDARTGHLAAYGLKWSSTPMNRGKGMDFFLLTKWAMPKAAPGDGDLQDEGGVKPSKGAGA